MSELFTKRELLEIQKPEYLEEHKVRLLGQLSLIEADVHLINDVLDGYGVEPSES